MQEGPLNNGNEYGIGPRLPRWLNWFMTPDNSLDGDYGWQHEHAQWRFSLPTTVASYVGQVGWLWRNPAYSLGLTYIDGFSEVTYSGDPDINDNDNAKEGSLFVRVAGLFQFVWVKRIGSSGRCIYVNLGWNIRALILPGNRKPKYRATFVFSPRISRFK